MDGYGQLVSLRHRLVQLGGRYLGIWLRTPGAHCARETGSGWRRAALVDAARHTWEKAQVTIQYRDGMLGRPNASMATREAMEHLLRLHRSLRRKRLRTQ